jgi:hypothetical protein
MASVYTFPDIIKGTEFADKKLRFTRFVNAVEVPMDFTGADITMQFKRSKDCDVVFEFKTADNSIIINNPANGEFTMKKRILDVFPTKYVSDIRIVFADGTPKTYMECTMNVLKNVSDNG